MVQIRDYVRPRRQIPVDTDRARFFIDPAAGIQDGHGIRTRTDDCNARIRTGSAILRNGRRIMSVHGENPGDFLREATSLALRDAVTSALAASGSLVQAAPDILRAVCTTFGWQTGALWTVEPD